MLMEPTVEKLRALRLEAMAAGLVEQRKDAGMDKLGFEERLGLLVDAEWTGQENRRLARRLREAKFRLPNACVEDIDFTSRRELDRGQIRQLATCRWITDHENVVVTGATGVGKTYLACALGVQSCRKGFRARYFRTPRLFGDLALARADGTHPQMLARLARIHVLVIEDFGLTALSELDRLDLLEILEDRYGVRSTILTSQLPPNRWHEQLGDPTIADAILDRVLHNAHKIALGGPSRRKRDHDQGDAAREEEKGE